MGRVLFALVCGLLVTVEAVRHTCPPDSQLSPCTCDGEGINCKKVKDDFGLKNALSRIGGGNYRGFWVQDTNIQRLTSNMFQGYKIGNFYLEVNNITEVQRGTFAGSESVVTGISIFGNKLTSFPFIDLKTMKFLTNFNLGRNQITELPASALSDHPRLSTIILAENKISNIGINAFSNLPNLMRLDLSKNALTVLGRYSLYLNMHHPGLQLSLSQNRISRIDQDAMSRNLAPALFRLDNNQLTTFPQSIFASIVNMMLNKGGAMIVGDNPFSCKGCDFLWLVHNKNVMQQFLIGFTCADERSLNDLYMFNIGCP